MIELLSSHPHWTWLSLGVLLMAAEALIPGVYLMWFGLAAALVGVITAALGLSLMAEVFLFAVISVGFVVGYRLWERKHPPEGGLDTSGKAVNSLQDRFVGSTLVLQTAIVAGQGRVKAGDTSWRCKGPDMPAGATVTVVAVEGGTLVVEPARPQQS